MILENIVRWIYLHRKGVIIAITAIIAAIFIWQFLTRNAFVTVNVTTPVTSESITTYASRPEGTEKVGSTGFMIIPRNTTNLIVTSGNYVKAETKLTLPWYGVASVDIQLERDKNADKVAFVGPYGDMTCATYSKRLDSLLSYRCTNPSTLLQYQTSDTSNWGNKAIAKDVLYPGKVAQPYMGGVIGISVYSRGDESAPQPIVYTTDTGSTIAYDTPAGIDESSLSLASIFTNYTDSSDNRFVLVTGDGHIYLGKPTGKKGEVIYSHVDPPENYTKTPHKTLCRIISDSVYCYTGIAPVGDGPVSRPNDDTIRVYDFDGNVTSTSNLHKSLLLSALYVTNDGKIYGKNYKKILNLKKEGGGFVANEVSQNADAAVATDTLYYTQNGGVYQLDSKDVAHQVFYSEKIAANYLYASDGKVFILGTINESKDKNVYAYTLKEDDDTTPGQRIIDLLPAETGQLPAVTSHDFVGNKLLMELAVPYNKTQKTGGIGDSDTALNEKKQAALNALSAMGINTSELDIHYVY